MTATYRLLADHYLPGGFAQAGTVVSEGGLIPNGWIPTLAVDPQSTDAIQAFWDQGPVGMDDAESIRDLYPLYWMYRTNQTVQPPSVYWVPVSRGVFQLTGAGSSLGPKTVISTTPAGPVLTSPTAVAASSSTANLGITTNKSGGTLYWVVTNTSTPPSPGQIILGEDAFGNPASASGNQSVTSSGVQSAVASGLMSGVAYSAHFMHLRSAVESNVASSVTFNLGFTLVEIVGPVPALINMAASCQDFTPGPSPYDGHNPNGAPAWSHSNASITTGFIDPDNLTTAQKLVENSSNSTHVLLSGAGSPFGNYCAINQFAHIQFRLAFIAKAAERTRVVAEFFQTSNGGGNQQASVGFDLAGGNVGYDNSVSAQWTILNASMTLITNGWYLCLFDVYSATITDSIVRFDLYPINIYLDNGSGTAARSITYTGNGSSGVELWWASLLPVGAWGLTHVALNDDFNDLSTIDINDTRAPGFNWYTHNLWPLTSNPTFGTLTNPPSPPSTLGAFSISSPSILEINDPNTNPATAGFSGQIWSAAATGDGSTYVGTAYPTNLVHTGRLKWNSSGYNQGSGGWSEFWLLTVEYLIGASDRGHEWDTMESGPSSITVAAGGTLWDHFYFAVGGLQDGIGGSSIGTSSGFSDTFHEYTSLRLTRGGNDGTNGVAMVFYDGIFVNSSDRTWTTTAPPIPAAGGTVPSLFVGDDQHFLPIIGGAANPAWPFFIDYVKIYTNPVTPIQAPGLYRPIAQAPTNTTVDLIVSTSKPSGTLYWVVTTSNTAPTAAQIIAGHDNSGNPAAAHGSQSVSTFGQQTIATVTGLDAATVYTAFFAQQDTQPASSNVVGSQQFGDATDTYWDPANKGNLLALSNHNLTVSEPYSLFAFQSVRESLGRSTGKWYWEITINDLGATSSIIGIVNSTASMTTYVGGTAKGAGVQSGNTFDGLVNGVVGDFSGGVTIASGDVYGFAFDIDAGKVWIERNGTWINHDPTGADIWSGATGGLWYPAVSLETNFTSLGITANFGGTSFVHARPAGYSPWNMFLVTYDTWSPTDKGAAITLSNGNLSWNGTNAGWASARTTTGKTSGKWYWEITLNAVSPGGNSGLIGIMNSAADVNSFAGGTNKGAGAQGSNTYNGLLAGITGDTGATVTFSQNDVIGFAFDIDAGKVWISVNGTWVTAAPSGADVWSGIPAGTWYPAASGNQLNATVFATANFGASAFASTVPAGFNAGWYF